VSPDESKSDLTTVEELNDRYQQIKAEIGKVIIGQDKVVDQLLVALLSSGHCLLVGVPGLAKTLLISTLPKTQAALLQAMQEHEVTAAGETYKLDEPFFVLATQNPIEQEGTYPLPEAQLDRFMFNIFVDYPSETEEREIVRTTTAVPDYRLNKILSAEDIIRFQQLVRRVPVSDHLIDYAVALVRATRPTEEDALDFVKNWVNWGAGPRASQYLILAAKTRAILDGRPTPAPDDVRFAANPVLRHRIVTSFNAEADGVDTMEIIKRILRTVKEKA